MPSLSSTLRRCGVVVAAAALLLLLPTQFAWATGGGNVSVTWQIPGAPSSGLTNITFPITVNPATDHQYGIFFAQQFSFGPSGMVGYIGLQPQPDSGNGGERLRAFFSIFGSGTNSTDANCHSGADAGAGTSCNFAFNAVYGHVYNLTVQRTGTDTWTGTATDTTTNTATHIGTWTLPTGTGNLNPSQGGFVEYYLYGSIPSCAQNPVADGVFGGPTSTDAGGLSGTVTNPVEYSSCVGQSNFQSQAAGSGQHVVRGFTTTSSFTSAASGRCLNVPSTNWDTQTNIADCTGAGSQSWTFVPDSPSTTSAPVPTTPLTAGGLIQGTLKLGTTDSSGNTLCLDDEAGGTTAGTKAIVWGCASNNMNQQWTLYPDGTVRSNNSGLCLDVYGAGTASGTPVELWYCNGGSNQRWIR